MDENGPARTIFYFPLYVFLVLLIAYSDNGDVYLLLKQVDVNGDSAAPLYKYLKSSKGGLFGDNIKWNFSKFLVDKEGNVVERYAPTTSPLSIEVRRFV